MNVVFVNMFHNGDLHISRQFVRKIMERFSANNYSYAHNCNPTILSDIPKLSHIPGDKIPKFPTAFGSNKIKDTLYLNTWYGSYNSKFNKSVGIAFDALYGLFDHNLKTHFKLSCKDLDKDPASFFPTIDFNKVHKGGVDKFITNSEYEKYILVCNGLSLSGQARNFSFAPILNNLSVKYPKYCFIYTNRDQSIKHVTNVKFSNSIIGGKAFDLNENGYLSTFCDLIIGRTSGAYTFSMIQDNLFKAGKVMISFSNIGTDNNKYWLGHTFAPIIKYKAKVLNYNASDSKQCIKIVDTFIAKL